MFYEFLNSFRIKDWVHYLGYVLLGSISSGNLNLINFLLASLMLAYAYSLNEYDKIKKKYFLFPLLISFFLLPCLNYFQFLIYLFFILTFTFYSSPKIWLEGRPLFSTLSNAIGFSLIFLLPFNSYEKFVLFFDLFSLLFLLNFAAQIIHEIVHYSIDKKSKKNTTCVKIGIKNSIFLLKINLIFIILLATIMFKHFKLISLSTIVFSLYFLFLTKINSETRKKFRYYGIICGTIYLIDLII